MSDDGNTKCDPDSITIKDCEDFIADCLRPERLALSVIEPGKA